MNIRVLHIFLLFIVSSLSNVALAQGFSKDAEAFVKEMDNYMSGEDRFSAKRFMPEFEKFWLSNPYSLGEQDEIIAMCDQIREKKMKAFPDMENFLASLMALSANERQGSFDDWIDVLQSIMALPRNSKRGAHDYLIFSNDFFTDQTLYKTQSGSVHWRAEDVDFDLTFESEQPVLKLKEEKTNLRCYAKGDSCIIYKTNGAYYPLEKKWDGEGGKVNWERAGLSEDQLVAKLQAYDIDMRRPSYEADSAIFTNKDYFNEPILGFLEDRVLADVREETATYPRFTSYNQRFVIQNIVPKVNYEGGFSQNGAQFLGSGSSEDPARIVIMREGEPVVTATAKAFVIRLQKGEAQVTLEDEEKSGNRNRNRIVTNQARVEILVDDEYIIHPGIRFTLYTDERMLQLTRASDGMSQSPFYDTYHNLELEFEQLTWNIDEPAMKLGPMKMSNNVNAQFTSIYYFEQAPFDALMGGWSRHPLSILKMCAEYTGNQMTIEGCGQCLGLSRTQVEPMMLEYSYLGYVDYNEETGVVDIREKMVHQVLARSGQRDYDVIAIQSQAGRGTDNVNATLSLLTYDLNLRGVDRINLSNAHNVVIYPDKGEVTVKKGLDFSFAGMINSGKVEFFGKNFDFIYDKFTLDLPVIDSMQLWASTERRDKDGYLLEARVRTVIQDLSGVLRIDLPMNKSGQHDKPKFPTFDCTKESYAYYDQDEVLGGAYPRDKFYFQLVPFTFDSLDNFKNENIHFDGVFHSAGIFPDIEETLVLQPDYSLGFTLQTPPGGFPAYGGRATYENTIDLSNKGLRGDGKLRYITSFTDSPELFFYPDSVNGVSRQFDIEEQLGAVEYPTVSGDTTYVHYEPYADFMDISTMSGKNPLIMFAGAAAHTGKLHYNHDGLEGGGVNRFNGAAVFSDLIKFKFIEFTSDTCDFELGVSNDLFDALDFSATNLHGRVDFSERYAEFQSNEGGTLTTFDILKYQAFLDRFTWYMDAEEIEFSAGEQQVDQGATDLQIEGAKFTSIHPEQDSLAFYSKAATYNLVEKRIVAKEVKFIDVADAQVIPSDGLVTIRANANMKELEGAKIIANRQLRYHEIYDAHVKISGMWKYKGEGTYDYKDMNGLIQQLQVSNMTVDTSRQSIGEGHIADTANFALSPQFRYRGDFKINANRRDLTFDGFAMANHDCSEVPKNWFGFESEIDPSEIMIEVKPEMRNYDDNVVVAGMMITGVGSELYSRFLSTPESSQDIVVSPAEGFLTYDGGSQEFRIASFQKLAQRSLPGPYVSLNTKTCMIEGEGPLNLGPANSMVELDPVGTYEFNTVTKDVEMRTSLRFDFLMDNSVLGVMTKDMIDQGGNDGIDFEDGPYELALREFIGNEETDELLGRLSLGKSAKTPAEVQTTFFIADVKMKWDPELSRWYSEGDVGIANVEKTDINQKFTGGIELTKKTRGTDFLIYVEVSPSRWYTFSYASSSGAMRVYSPNKEFMEAVIAVKKDKARAKAEVKGQRDFYYLPGTKREQSSWKRRNGGDEEE